MKLHLENFAKISSADIEFNGLTVIAGDNNTGKSTIGKALYSLFRGTSNIDRRIVEERIKSVREAVTKVARADVSDEECRQLMDGGLTVHDLLFEKFKKEFSGDAAKVMLGEVDQVARDFAHSFEDAVKAQIEGVRAMPDDRVAWIILRRVFNCVFHGQYYPLKKDAPPARLVLTVKGRENTMKFYQDHAERSSEISLFAHALLLSNPDVMGYVNVRGFETDERFMRILDKNVYELAKQLLKSESKSPGILETQRADFLSAALAQLDEMIEGTFAPDSDGDLALSEEGNDIPTKVQNLSMGMKSLLLLRLLLTRGILSEKDVLILDEPENHLHPEWQVFYAKALVLIQKAYNLTMMVTTHSQFFVNALQRFSISEGISEKTNFYLSKKDEARSGYCTFEPKGQFAGRIINSFNRALGRISKMSNEFPTNEDATCRAD